MKPYLVDVPVRMNIWIRPQCQRKQWDVIKQARPSILFIQSDGGRNEKEWEAIYQNRKMVDDELDWDCKVYKCYMDENQGMYAMSQIMGKMIWENVDRCVLLEDDYVPSVSYFRFCAEMLERYKDDQRIGGITGMNHEGVSKDVTTDYFFAETGSIWGTATWKRVIEERKKYDYSSDPYVMKLLLDRTKGHKEIHKAIVGYAKNDHHGGHVKGGEFYGGLNIFMQNRLLIIPKKNMINNIGFGDDAAHSTDLKKLPRGIRQVYNMKTYELEFPMKHPKFVIPDYGYRKRRDRIMGDGYPLVKLYRKLEHIFLVFKYDGIKIFLQKAKKFNKKRIEN